MDAVPIWGWAALGLVAVSGGAVGLLAWAKHRAPMAGDVGLLPDTDLLADMDLRLLLDDLELPASGRSYGARRHRPPDAPRPWSEHLTHDPEWDEESPWLHIPRTNIPEEEDDL